MTGRPMHTAWYGFSKVIIADKRAVAQCDKCKKIITNPQKKRLENHK